MCTRFRVTKKYVLFIVLNLFAFRCLVAQGKFQNNKVFLPAPSSQALKQTMTGSQKKLGTDLLQLTDQKYLPEGFTLQSHAESMRKLNQYRYQGKDILQASNVKEGEVYVYIYLEPNVLTGILNPLVTKMTDIDERNHIVVAWIKVKDLENLASLLGVKHVQSVVPPVTNTGSVTTQGDSIHKTANVRRIYSQSGTGIKVGIISDGVDHRSSAQTTNDLPADGAGLTVLSNTYGGDEGTAMLEIVHDMVPGSALYFHDCGTNTLAFNRAIDALVSAGCKIICDDISWITEPFFEDGPVASHVASALSSNKIIYVSSAGNSGDSHYQGDYYPQPSGSSYHDFTRGGSTTLRNLYIKMTAGGTVQIVLEWNDKFGSSGNDYDLYLYSLNPSLKVAQSIN
ncbi:MAG: hypothetical protein NTX44_10800, partial [Ignavibacteriales bacterium]|nr:hypothetical protein [Ignavibacteriales bacterium]